MTYQMALANGKLPLPLPAAKELLEAQAHIWNHTFNFINSISLKCAIQLGIPDAIHEHGQPMTLSELADALHINKAKSDGLFRLMRILVHSKFFEKVKGSSGDEAYCLTRASRLLLRDEPLSMAAFVGAMVDPVLMDPFHHVSEWFGDDHPSPFFTKNGKSLWEFGGVEGRWNQAFNEAMASDAILVTSVLVEECKHVFEGEECKHVFEGVWTMVDVGGGVGTVAKGVAAAFSGLKCVVLDLPHVVEGLEGSENLKFVGGDMFESIPHAHAVFLKWILHDWSDQECVRILEKCREAIAPSKSNGGKVIIVDMIVDDEREEHKETEVQLLFDVLMMAEVIGKERSEKEWVKLFYAAGFTKYKITHAVGLRSVMEVFP